MARASVIETGRVRSEEGIYAWTQEQAALLRQYDALDWENLAEKIAAVGGSDRGKVERRRCAILLHLLKWQAQPALRGASWRNPDGVKDAVDETGLPAGKCPGVCPHAPDAVLAEDLLPDAGF
jgi:hypothetical protein